MEILLKNKNIILTGGGRGIGRIVAQKCDLEGANLALIDIIKENLVETKNLLRNQNKHSFFKVLDISIEDSVRKNFEEIINRFDGKIDVLINNAGIQGPIGEFPSNNISEWKRNVEINLFGTAHCTHAVLPYMVNRKYGKIINLSGGGSTSPRPNFTAYGVSKTAIVRFTETLAEELRQHHIDVNAISPGAINTKMLEEILLEKDKAGKEYNQALSRKENGGNNPEFPVNLICFLASSLSDGITGKLISAIWDPWQDTGFQTMLKEDKDLATLRRIDNKYFERIK